MRHPLLLGLVLALSAWSSAPATEPAAGLTLHRDLPREPLMVLGVWLDDPTRDLDPLLLFGGPFVGMTTGGATTGAERSDADRLGAARAELLSSIGSEIVMSLDVRSIDEATLAFRISPARGLSVLLARVGFVTSVRDPVRLDHALRQVSAALGGDSALADGLTRVGLPFSSATPEAAGKAAAANQVDLFYKIQGGRLTLGFSREWVTETLAPRPEGQRLIDGEDWRAVFADLDDKPRDLVYINLPKLHKQIQSSELAQVLFRSNPDLRAVSERFFTPEGMSLGVGSTSVRSAGGIRTRNFGPTWMSGAGMSTGALVALAAPQIVLSIDRGRARRSAIDVQAIARACDNFSSKARSYPGPTAGWVPVERIALQLEPVYISQLPRTDAWANPILYWSNGGSYRVLSTGKDGRMDQDWSSVHEPAPPAGIEGDIVFGDTGPIAAPSDLPAPK
jgi:hypothetical protein